ncbi:hypothetical protein QFW77_00445 [Luteimonas sp. RD2P54]|uniref:DUF6249 domain-containing protein n=1 Tax=Luteimonas endophytica TaxID=3042023 RepID=A0ABT6J3W2_9GAMM|nr:DUF6249 domain-containing protein [Luteimonas endophytica]MDH5821464.1 hypothetical protein [Luteimonas endophytica]
MFDILAILIPFFLAACIVVVVRIVVEARLRRRLAETHATEDLVHSLAAADHEFRRQSSLRWGLVLVAMGLGFGAIDLFGLDAKDPAAFGLLFAAAGVGSLAYHFARRRPPA